MDHSTKLYMLLEVERLKESHHEVKNCYVYPVGRLEFMCVNILIDKKIIFLVYKVDIKEEWTTKFLNIKPTKDFNFRSTILFDTIKQISKFLCETNYENIPYLQNWLDTDSKMNFIKYCEIN